MSRFWKWMALCIPVWVGAAIIVGLVSGVTPISESAIAGFIHAAAVVGALWVLVAIGGAAWSVIHVSKRSADNRKQRKGLAERADHEHQMLMRGDITRGTFGQFPPDDTE